jgi:rod shape-determining protein MreC
MRGSRLGARTFFLVLLAVIIIISDHRTAALAKVRAVLSTAVVPLQYVVNAPVAAVDWMATSISSHKALVEENTSLQIQQILLKAQLQKLLTLEKENQQLRDLVKSFPTTSSTKMLIAQVLAVDSDPFLHQIVVDRGSEDNVYVGQPVLDVTGVMGQVVSVASSTSRIMLLSDSSSAIPIEVARNNVRGIAVGGGALGYLYLEHIPETTDIKVGDDLVSSGLGMRYPVGYPVGTVTKVTHASGEPFMNIEIQPAAYLERSRLVLLVWPVIGKTTHQVDEQVEQMQAEKKQLKQQKLRGFT